MNIDHLIGNFEKRRVKKNLVYKIGEPASENQIKNVEAKLEVLFPDQLRMFYSHYNGLKVEEPPLEIFNVEKLVKINNLIHFSNINKDIKICFDCKELNQAKQWNIINYDDGYRITLTFASFWSNKIWAWIDKKREIWAEEIYEDH